MSCCGSQRAALRQNAVSSGGSPAASFRTGPLEFEYNGGGELRVVGPMTGRVYAFSGSGSRLVVDAADAPSLATVPALRPVR